LFEGVGRLVGHRRAYPTRETAAHPQAELSHQGRLRPTMAIASRQVTFNNEIY